MLWFAAAFQGINKASAPYTGAAHNTEIASGPRG